MDKRIILPLKVFYDKGHTANGFVVEKDNKQIKFQLQIKATKKMVEKTLKRERIDAIYDRRTGKKIII